MMPDDWAAEPGVRSLFGGKREDAKPEIPVCVLRVECYRYSDSSLRESQEKVNKTDDIR
jgi:hypothetical protein